MPKVDNAQGTSLSLSTSTGVATMELLDIGGPSLSRESLQTSHMGTTGAHTFIPGDLYDPGDVTATVHLDPTIALPISTALGTVTVTFPDDTTWTADAFCTGYNPTASLEQIMTAELSLKLSGEVTLTTN